MIARLLHMLFGEARPDVNWGKLAMRILDGKVLFGRDLRGILKENGWRGSSAAFYRMMANLEDVGFVDSWYQDREIDGFSFRERMYRVTSLGSDQIR